MMAHMPTPPPSFEHLDPLDASLGDFEPTTPPPNQQTKMPLFGYPSHHSGFRSDLDAESDLGPDPENSVSAGGYSPPAWRRLGNGSRDSGFWRRSEDILGAFPPPDRRLFGHRSRESSPELDTEDEDEDVLRRAMRTRLPTGSMSPDKGRSPSPEPRIDDRTIKLNELQWKETNIRFALRAEVQQRTEPIEAFVQFFRSKWQFLTHSWSSTILSTIVAVLAISAMRNLFQPAAQLPVPDLVKVAGIARSFEPLIYFSENGASQVGDLQATGVAVWDLGESVRSSNMTSAPIIVKELDDLSDSLKTLAIELTKFFANVDGDIDGILIVMDWARRELSHVQHLPSSPFTAAFDNIHNILSQTGVLEDPGGIPTRLGSLSTYIFGMSNPQRTKLTLQRTFNEFLTVLEDAINSELQHSLALFALFEAIDHQFLNLARTVVREASAQDDQHADLLSSLWTRILGPNSAEVAKYERNRLLLQNVREKTVRNKSILVEHNGKLMALKANLENLRRKLVSPLVRSVNSSTLTLEDQIRGLEDVGGYLEGVRTRQKGKLMEMLYGSIGNNRRAIDERKYDRTA
ncbi:hypothetical protein K4K61_003117 [Colletotrichum sp. SAR11_59]|uniref:uncharacterized protein n=1 Tax=Colletotrichum chrysophilum TaxID=1836956 RepID=UPI002301BC84|nr:uncharacterized protein COL26b_012149 [Colletotrichum chrysophilum]KAI8153557.1 hypothetical protein K4K50_008354 [Colletotrichum sp. SAR 10_71]KAI8165429.1 hypothetical protein K4K49_005798 [Colletotrichum sp. SAR 10_70]KAI8175495.1 hypothetical protein KHU50_004206 [Colletotrichum sp. SAR 10_65]KAI8178332.1 hypothetical protein K4K51_004725 [Colletotrichum sp. SAR 10_75]KAI8204985.1 hypothetical protein K4K52_004657 [Colletotrichum sp. SAR 10_76]KAI8234182.1 hypothetical protein K4K54_00